MPLFRSPLPLNFNSRTFWKQCFDCEFRKRVVGLERMLRVRDSLQDTRACASEQDLNDSVSEVGSGQRDCASENEFNGSVSEVGSGQRDCASENEFNGSVFEVGTGQKCASDSDFNDVVSEFGSGQGGLSAHCVHRQLDATAGERVRNLELRILHATAVAGRATTAGESKVITGSLER